MKLRTEIANTLIWFDEFEDRPAILEDILKTVEKWAVMTIAKERLIYAKIPINDPEMSIEQKNQIIGEEKGLVKAQEILKKAI